MTRIALILDDSHILALSELARQEYRDVQKQAALIIRDELTRRGLLPQEQPTTTHPLQTLEAV
jgi:hypothetical protein